MAPMEETHVAMPPVGSWTFAPDKLKSECDCIVPTPTGGAELPTYAHDARQLHVELTDRTYLPPWVIFEQHS